MKDLVEMATHITGVGQQSQNVLFLGLAHVLPRGHSRSPAPAGLRKQGKTGGSGSPRGRSDGDDLRPSKPTDNCPHRWKRENQQFWGVKKEGSKYVCKRCGRSDGVTSAGHTPGPFCHCPYYDMTCDGCGWLGHKRSMCPARDHEHKPGHQRMGGGGRRGGPGGRGGGSGDGRGGSPGGGRGNSPGGGRGGGSGSNRSSSPGPKTPRGNTRGGGGGRSQGLRPAYGAGDGRFNSLHVLGITPGDNTVMCPQGPVTLPD
uniref:Uncharacterized protein n=1 Tax=Chromera velia CCMP2878 TaxID=1169474 RepID=A0A0G4F488_9ALVE|eukprot:Cvel_2716.t1-p1 / transcript=Cvel_2716.t1 / gene=Cvel_2716 / organism=Chromera_velia_CCMP2878 / gene_product=hypothetical protein / transcript_product=hypothetical protein / location=Cvel_scaffold109:29127-29897(+) / protein_length=257 / sequence_SO=supercontig / SO=protein_coding / is_pseudo=false